MEIKIMDKKVFGISATLASGIYFGFLPLLMTIVYSNGGNSFTGAFLRFAFAVPLFYFILKVKKTPLGVTKEEFGKLVLITVCGFAGTCILLFSSYLFIPTGMATTIHFLYPTVTVIGLIIFCKEKIHYKKIIAVILCLVGVVLFYKNEGGANIVGIALAVLSSFTYGFYTIYFAKSGLKDLDSIKSIFYMTWIGTIMLGIIGLISGNLVFTLKPVAWGIMALVACLTSFIGALGYQLGVKYIGSESTAVLSTFEPITSVIVGVLICNEDFSLRTAIGCIAILTATIIIARMKE